MAMQGLTLLLAQRLYWTSTDGKFSTPPPYSPDVAPSDYHLFPKMKIWSATQGFSDNEELMEGVKTWLHTQAASLYEEGIQKLITRYDKCLHVYGDYVEK